MGLKTPKESWDSDDPVIFTYKYWELALAYASSGWHIDPILLTLKEHTQMCHEHMQGDKISSLCRKVVKKYIENT